MFDFPQIRSFRSIVSNWHGKPSYMNNNNNYNTQTGRQRRQCWICGNKEHVARNCPKRIGQDDEKEEEAEATINNLFIGMMSHH